MTGSLSEAGAISGATSAVILVVTVAALVVLVGGLRDLLATSGWREGATTAFVFAALCSSLVDVVVSFAGPQWTVTLDAYGNVLTALPGWASQVQRGFYLVVLVGCMVTIVVRAARPGTSVNVPALLVFLTAALSGWSASLHGDEPLRPYYLVTLAILAATSLAPRGAGVVVGLGTFCALAALCAGLTAVVVPDFSTFSCGPGKCGILGFNFRGFLDNENALALYFSLGMPFVYLTFGWLRGWLLSSYLLFLVLLSGSRTGALAGILTYVLLIAVRPDLRRPTASWSRIVPLLAVLSLGLVGGLVLPFLVDDPRTFTGRAHLWILARSSLSSATEWMFGSGALGWQHVRDAGLIDFSAVYSVHNQWLQVLYTTGLVGAALMAAALVLLVRQAGLRYASVIGCVLTPVVFLAITERPWSLDLVDWLSWALPGALLCYPVIRDKVETMDETASAAGPASPELVPGGLGADAREGGLLAVLRRRTSETRSGS